MSATSTPPPSQRPILESIAMRLDAAMEALVQARDFLVRQLEYQMVQLQEMRQAVSELVNMPVEATIPSKPEPTVIEVPSMGEPTPAYSATAAAQPLEALFEASADVETSASQFGGISLFEKPPGSHWGWESPEADGGVAVAEPEVRTAEETAKDSFLSYVSAPGNSIDPALEKATIDELNDALSRAFAQIAARGGMKRQN